jgi:hypothetical protein
VAEIAFDRKIKSGAGTDDTLALIIRTANIYSKSDYARECAKELCPAGTSRAQCLRNIFDYYCRNVIYKLDPRNKEIVNTPMLTILQGEGDCKKAATWLAAILIAAGIQPTFKHVYYDNNFQYTHIYIIVGTPDNYVTLDPTNQCQFNAEVKSKKQTLYYLNGQKMDLHLMGRSEVHDNTPSGVAGINWSGNCSGMEDDLQHIGDSFMGAVKAKIQPIHKLTHAAVMTALIPNKPALQKALANIPVENQRGSFLAMVEQNYNGIATNMAAALGQNPNSLDKVWTDAGGDLAHMKATVLAGAKVKPTTDATIKGPEYLGAPEYIGFNFKHLLHAAAGILHAVAAVVAIVYPPAGAVLNAIGDKCEAIATDPTIPDITTDGKKLDVTYPPDKTGTIIPNTHVTTNAHGNAGHGGSHHGSFFSLHGFIFKSLLILTTLNINHDLQSLLGTIAIVAPIAYLVIKKSKLKWTLVKK